MATFEDFFKSRLQKSRLLKKSSKVAIKEIFLLDD